MTKPRRYLLTALGWAIVAAFILYGAMLGARMDETEDQGS